MYRALADAIRDATARDASLATVALELESKDQARPVQEIRAALGRALAIMRQAVTRGEQGDLKSRSGLVGGDAAKLSASAGESLIGAPFRNILSRALAVQEVNAAMGVIVAAPTAGGAGVLPAVLTGLAAMGLGLLVSALAATVDRAMTVLPVLLIFQMLLAMGGVFPDVVEKPGLKQASYIAGTQWGFATAASTIELERLQSVDKIASNAPTIRLDAPMSEFEALADNLRPTERWTHDAGTWLTNVAALLGLAALGIAGAGLAVRRRRPEA